MKIDRSSSRSLSILTRDSMSGSSTKMQASTSAFLQPLALSISSTHAPSKARRGPNSCHSPVRRLSTGGGWTHPAAFHSAICLLEPT